VAEIAKTVTTVKLEDFTPAIMIDHIGVGGGTARRRRRRRRPFSVLS
jgi:hypothetical protein